MDTLTIAKRQATLRTNLSKILNDNFDENDLKGLLIDARAKDLISSQSLLREIADSIAHETRNKGISHRAINHIYAKIIYGSTIGFPEKPKFNAREVQKKIFEDLIQYGIEKADEEKLVQRCNMTKDQLGIMFKQSYSYKRRESKYVLIKDNNIPKIVKLLNVLLSEIRFEEAFTESELSEDIVNEMINIGKYVMPEYDLKPNLQSRRSELILCLLSILNDSKFKLFDGTIASSQLVANLPPPYSANTKFEDYILALTVSVKVKQSTMTFYIVSTNLRIAECFDEHVKLVPHKPMPNCVALRNEKGDLKLCMIENGH